jgi:hypothetical protein
MRLSFALAALAATTAFATPAFAQNVTGQSSDTVDVSAILIQPATLEKLDDLSFGMIIAAPTASGNVTIDPDTGLRTVAAPLVGSPTIVGGRGRLVGSGMPNQPVTISASFPTLLHNSGDRTQTVEFVGQLDAASRANGGRFNIGNTGAFFVGVGGTITIDSGQVPGLYEGQVTVTADFQ